MRFPVMSRTCCALLLGLLALPASAAIQKPRVTNAVDRDSAYTNWRWIGVLDRSVNDCPAVQGWRAARLFDPVVRSLAAAPLRDQAKEDLTLLAELGLDRFCVYTADRPGTPFPVKRLPRGLAAAARDRRALAVSGALEERVAPVLSSLFQKQAGGSTTLSLQGDPAVWLTFLDSQPDSAHGAPLPIAPPPGSQHGFTLLHLAHNLLCAAPGPCAVDIASRRALDYNDPEKGAPSQAANAGQAGQVGLVSSLSTAIVQEVVASRQSGGKHLVINLSIGWDGELFDDFVAFQKMDPTVQGVYSALRFAARRGALVVAAAGNRRGGPVESQWPILPAAWEVWSPPDTPERRDAHLVYAVGGVDWQGLPLANSRAGGHAWLAAYGDHATVAAGRGYTQIYTGSSVAAAVVSSAAAAVWSVRPELAPDEVIRLLLHAGKDLAAPADFYPGRTGGAPAPPMRLVSLCPAVAEACGPDQSRCPKLGRLNCPAWEPHEPELFSLFSGALPAGVMASGFQAAALPPDFVPPCDPALQLRGASGGGTVFGMPPAVSPCPSEQFGSVASQRWVLPQPEDDPCPGCSVLPKPPTAFFRTPRVGPSIVLGAGLLEAQKPTIVEPGTKRQSYTLEIAIDPKWQPRLVSATLEIERVVNGETVQRWAYPIDVSAPGLREIANLGDGQLLKGCRAQLNFVVKKDDGTLASFQNPVVIDP